MKSALLIAQTSFRELMREKISFAAFGGAFFLLALSLVLGEMTIDESERLLADLGFAATEFAVCALALFAGSFALAREIERQTCLLILSKPISRSQFLVGKWAGVAFLLLLFVIVFCLTLLILIRQPFLNFIPIAASILVKSWILLSWTLFVSTLTRPILALISGLALYLLGHWQGDLLVFAVKSEDPLRIWIVENLRWIVPSFDLFNWKNYFHLVEGPLARDILGMSLQGAAWVSILLVIGGFFFRRKDLV